MCLGVATRLGTVRVLWPGRALAVDRDSAMYLGVRGRSSQTFLMACPPTAPRGCRVCPLRGQAPPGRRAAPLWPASGSGRPGCQVPVRDSNGREALWRPFAGMRRLLCSGHGQRGGMAGGEAATTTTCGDACDGSVAVRADCSVRANAER
jgi:hypothetical protein